MDNSTQTPESILGYDLKSRIGSGSYGEVWSAEAPGGVPKAVKLVYGYHDDKIAQSELKSLNRIKEVRHPFLLSLERIDVVNGQLVVVTELADMSLLDWFATYVEDGLPGIPRDELLGYMRDAADALDYLYNEHNLQHLDVKPENLLLLGGHVKVADFGLVKEIKNMTQSLMTGLTPAYAPPELFDGQPGTNSDQYSLAIVFQEMLTGDRPFKGGTAAQLATQHLHGRPVLTQLPKGDQPIVAKALSKNAEHRYPSCREFVDELQNSQSRRRPTQTRRPKTDDSFDQPVYLEKTLSLTENLLAQKKPSDIRSLPPVLDNFFEATTQPTLVIGVGNTGTRVLQKLRGRLRNRLGPDDALPAIKMLCIDTDNDGLIEASGGESVNALAPDETLAMPLRTPTEYRDGPSRFDWLSRRWIYNVPRSLQTEGLRPLGRLAFVDHIDQYFQKIQEMFSKIADAQAVAQTSETTGLIPGDDSLRIFIVTSIAGGAGSGMVADVAFATRVALSESQLRAAQINGILLHSTAENAQENGIAVGNTYACLTEILHYDNYGYPGDSSCGLPAVEEAPTFSDTYLVHLGDELTDYQYAEATDSVAEYLYQNIATRASQFFDSCRLSSARVEFPTLRTFGLTHSTVSRTDIANLPAQILFQQLVDRWLGKNCETPFDPKALVSNRFEELQLTTKQLVARVHRSVAEVLGVRPHEQVLNNIVKTRESSGVDTSNLQLLAEHATSQLAEILGSSEAGGADTTDLPAIHAEIRQKVSEISRQVSTDLATHLLQLVNDPEARVAGALTALEHCSQRLAAHADALARADESHEAQLRDLANQLSIMASKRAESLHDFDSLLLDLIETWLHRIAVHYSIRLSNAMITALNRENNVLLTFARDLEGIAGKYQEKNHNDNAADLLNDLSAQEDLDGYLLRSVTQRIPTLVQQTNLHIEDSFLRENGGLSGVLSDGAFLIHDLPARIQESAQAVIVAELKDVSIDDTIRASGLDRDQLVAWTGERLAMTAPHLMMKCGGALRLMLGVPEHTAETVYAGLLSENLDVHPNTIPSTCGDLVFCYEVEQIPVTNIAYALLECRPDCADFVSRLHTRNDVDWCQLTDV